MIGVKRGFNSLQDNKFLDGIKFKAFANDKFKTAKIMISDFDGVENVGKGENAGHQYFLPFPQCFQKDSSTG